MEVGVGVGVAAEMDSLEHPVLKLVLQHVALATTVCVQLDLHL